jgi:DNA-directed RNA polymerase subunit RPC12/RpoP
MKLKFWQSEFEFNKDDATIVVPLILLLLSFATPLPKVWLLVAFAAYYGILFFGGKLVDHVRAWLKKRSFRCPHCRSLSTVTLGMDDYLGDCPYYFYRCNDCGKESVYVDDKLVIPGKWTLTSTRPATTISDSTEISDKYIPF